MRPVTLDASVILKWYLHLPDEQDLPQAGDILKAILQERLTLVQPPHTLLEVAAVLVRERPERNAVEIPDLQSVLLMGRTVASNAMLNRALALSRQLDHHLFDTLYHAVALEEGATLITADRRYFEKAQGMGSIVLLEDYPK